MELEKENPGKKLNEIYIIVFHFVWGPVSCSVLFTSGKAVQLTWYEFSIYLHQLQPLSVCSPYQEKYGNLVL